MDAVRHSVPSMSNPDRGDPALCRVVELEWDRGHDKFEAIVRARTDAGIVVTQLHDLVALEGLTWIRGDELLDVDDLDDDRPEVRLANLRGARTHAVDPSLTELPALLAHLADAGVLLFVHQARTGSDEGLVGRVAEIDDGTLVLDEVDTSGRFTGDTYEFAIDDIISVEWGTAYLVALTELAGSPADSCLVARSTPSFRVAARWVGARPCRRRGRPRRPEWRRGGRGGEHNDRT